MFDVVVTGGTANSVAPPLLRSISQGGSPEEKKIANITAKAFSYIRTEFGASRSRRVGVMSAPN